MEGLVPHDRGVAQPGSAPRSGRGSRRFKSSRPDQKYIDQEDLKRLSADLWEEQVACTRATGSEVAGPEAKSSRPDQKYIDQKDLKRPVSGFDSIEPRRPLVPALPTCCRWPPAYFTVIGAPCPLSRPPQAYSRADDLDLWLLRQWVTGDVWRSEGSLAHGVRYESQSADSGEWACAGRRVSVVRSGGGLAQGTLGRSPESCGRPC